MSFIKNIDESIIAYMNVNCYDRDDDGIKRNILPTGKFEKCTKKIVIPRGADIVRPNDKLFKINPLFRTNLIEVMDLDDNKSCRSSINDYQEIDYVSKTKLDYNTNCLYCKGFNFYLTEKEALKHL